MPSKKAKLLYSQLLKELEEYKSPCNGNSYIFDNDESIPYLLRYQHELLAKDLCKDCKLMYLCLDYAVEANEPYGIWGGTTPAEREKINSPLNKAVRMVKEAEKQGIALPMLKPPTKRS